MPSKQAKEKAQHLEEQGVRAANVLIPIKDYEALEAEAKAGDGVAVSVIIRKAIRLYLYPITTGPAEARKSH